MKKIVLLCAAGMTTGILVMKMRKAAEQMNYECEINAYAVEEASTLAKDADIILLGPQVGYQLKSVKKSCPGIPAEVIDVSDYGTMNGNNVLLFVQKILSE